VEKGDGLTDRVLGIACNKDITQFKHLFTQSVKKKFTDNHLWFSVFSRPTKSNFTRLQRISCCMSVLFCTMIANAMFYKAEPSSVQPLVKLGPLKFTMAQVIKQIFFLLNYTVCGQFKCCKIVCIKVFTSIVSTLIVVPVNVIVVTLFRKSKLRSRQILPVRSSHVAKQQFWRQNVKSVNLGIKNTVYSISGDDVEANKVAKSSSFKEKL
jgi:polycystin 1L2